MLKGAFKSAKARRGDSITDVLITAELASSKGEARRLLSQNAVKLNGKPAGEDYVIKDSDKIAGGSAVIKKGKNSFAVIDL